MLVRALGVATLLLASAAVVACSEPPPATTADPVSSEDQDLIGGRYLKDGDLPSTIRVKDSCTSSVVGKHHILTGAHCVWKQAIDPRYVDGATIEISSAATITDATPHQRLTIKHTHVAPEWVENCTGPSTFCMGVGVDDEHRASDVAIVETVEEIANIPIAAIDVEPLQPGESVIVTGYGCQGSVGGYWSYASNNLKAGVVQLLPASATLHSGSTVNDQTLPIIAAHDLVTPGPAWPTPGPGLCPGDSGGPLYRAKSGGATIVGTNASYTFTGSGGLPVTNWHTRLDRATARNVAGWLASTGATTCEGASCPTRLPAAELSAPAPAPAQVASLVSDGRDVSCQRAALDLSKPQAAIDELLGSNAFCMSLNGQRVSVEDRYVYGSIAYCWLAGGASGAGGAGAPTPERIAAFPTAMEAKGYKGFTYRNGIIQGAIYSQACDTYPTGDVACRGSVPSLEKLTSDIKQSSGERSSCIASEPQPVGGNQAYAIAFQCQIDADLAPPYQQYLVAMMGSLRYRNVTYDAATRSVTGVAFSLPCSVFSSSQP